MNCRFCKDVLTTKWLDLINSPLSNAFLSVEQLAEPESYFPLTIYVCKSCRLVQVDEYKKERDILNNDYVYFSSYSKSWVEHARVYVEDVTTRFHLNEESLVVEVASNDGYFLQQFKEKGIPVLGIEPSKATANVAALKGINTITEYFTAEFASHLKQKRKKANLLVGNNVLAHVPDIDDFVEGLKVALRKSGVITMEFPHLLCLVEDCQFDSVYHEHYSYLSFTVVKRIFEAHALEMFDVEETPTHGGSLRIFAKHKKDSGKLISPSVKSMLLKEEEAGILTDSFYENFQERVDKVKWQSLKFLVAQNVAKKKVIGYGAAAKGNTFLNFIGIKGNDLIRFVVDAAPSKQGKFLPGSHIPVVDESNIREYRPDFIIIFPWNQKTEIMEQLSYVHEWGCVFVVFIPTLKLFEPELSLAT